MKPTTSFIARLCSLGRFEPIRNQWLRIVAGVEDNINCVLSCDGQIDLVSTTATNADPQILRMPKPQAISTRVNNPPNNPALQLFEGLTQTSNDSALIRQLAPGETYEIPLGGKNRLSGRFISAGTFKIVIRTLQRCECLNPRIYGEVEVDPIGGQLL